jgi:hypothetical protein
MAITPRSRTSRRRIAFLAAAVLALGLAGLLQAPAGAATAGGPETRPFQPSEEDAGAAAHSVRANSPAHVPAAGIPRPATLPVAADASKRIEGLTLKDQRDSNGGNSFSLEPPDQALCVGTTEVIEGVNNVFATYAKAGGPPTSGPQSYDPFWNDGTAEILRTTPPVFGPFVSDPKCYWDPDLNRFFMTELELGTDPATGDFNGDSFVNIAVSKTATPTTSAADWFLYSLNVRNDGTQGTPSHDGCPCLGDQPLIGADRFGFYITTNEFSIEGPDFNGAQIYAFDKAALTNNTMKVQRIEQNKRPLAEGIAYSVQPATSPVAAEWSSAANGTEYALSALDFNATRDDRIAAWAFTNTQSLTTAAPAVRVSSVVLTSEVYAQPPRVRQKTGPFPLGQSLKDKLNLLEANDDRMNQTVFSGGKLWSGVNTAIKADNGPTTVGIAYFVVTPTTSGTGTTTAAISRQGYVAVNRDSLMFPSIAVTAGGSKAAMVFTLAGPGTFPSVAYVRLTPSGATTGPVTVFAAGTRPADGFTGYPQFGGGGIERWGDYSAAVADAAGTLWTAGEYIPGSFGFPPYLANWGTAVGAVS